MEKVYLLDGARTAFGGFAGSLKNVSSTDLGVTASKAALDKAKVDAKDIEQAVFGNVIHTSTSAVYLARHIALYSGVPQEKPALTVNRLCGSGLQAAISAAQSMMLGEAQTALVGGAENMSMSPHADFKTRANGAKFGSVVLEDMLLNTLTDAYTGVGMGMTAENLAQKYDISRKEQDEFAYLSHMRAAEARNNGRFAKEITPVSTKKGLVDKDEHIRAGTSADQLVSLKPTFKKDGTVTAGNSSGINDGAAALVLASDQFVNARNRQPLAEIVSWGIAGVDPNYMGIGPVPAIKQALSRAGLQLSDISLIEVNEAFAAQYLAVEKELGLDRDITNVNGGAIALGHPVGASGSRILLSLAYELRERGCRYGLASLCIGGGQGIAMIIKNMNE
ncbi:acetyl-CoA acetyltransferase [Scopulibacillus darangshiensis]|uniref:acetyl-CoA C-acetyltransferase n=1 Tax=Scopulibacillus darangshiensis TaxID=442528 RepID=A0A4R2PCC8_9BACL|nr:acetyl-CoA C-acetyltransferase [Scopulibacillus darangshiensis]TCP31741.1 acetyl-CoA acetyltransferase [Scopulibacillus darangshiensis]